MTSRACRLLGHSSFLSWNGASSVCRGKDGGNSSDAMCLSLDAWRHHVEWRQREQMNVVRYAQYLSSPLYSFERICELELFYKSVDSVGCCTGSTDSWRLEISRCSVDCMLKSGRAEHQCLATVTTHTER